MKALIYSLRGLLFLFLAMLAVPSLCLLLYAAWELREAADRHAREKLMAISRGVAARQEQLLATTHQMLKTLAPVSEAAPCHGLVGLKTRFPTYANIGVVDTHGKLLCDALATRAPQDFSDRQWFRDVMAHQDFVISNYLMGRIVRRPVQVAAHPALSAEGRFRGAIFASIDLGWLDDFIARVQLPEGVHLALADRTGTILAHYPKGQDAVRAGQPLPDSALLAGIRAGKAEGFATVAAQDGTDRLAAFVRLGTAASDGEGYLIASMDSRAAFADSRALLQNIAWIAAFFLLAFIVAGYGANRFVLDRVRDLAGMARRIAAGDYSVRTHIGKSRGELDELAQTLDGMADSVQLAYRQSEAVIQYAPEPMLVTDQDGRIVAVNIRTEAVFGYERSELIGQPVEILVPARKRACHVSHRTAYAAHPQPRPMGSGLELLARRKDGSEFPVEVSLGSLQTDHGLLTVCYVRDVSERKRHEAQIEHQATHDALTGLPNRVLFRGILSQAMLRAQRSDTLLAVMFLDLDGFKDINDTRGHEYGDKVLKEVAVRLAAALRGEDMVARQGGDEFAGLLDGLANAQDAAPVAEKLLAAVSRPMVIDGESLHLTASLGITIFPFDDGDVDSLLRDADIAMYRAKEDGRGCFRFYSAEMNAQLRERVDIQKDLHHAIEEGQFFLCYQPRVTIESGRLAGMEALIRWQHPVRGVIPPDRFIPVAERSGLIVPIGEWVLREACRQTRAWQEAGWPWLRVSVNLSARQFRQPDLPGLIGQVLDETGLDADALELEITEGTVMHDTAFAANVLARLKRIGVHIAVDDFGTGYSSLGYLKLFPLDSLKIDRSFVSDVTRSPDDAAIARAIIAMAHSLKLSVIAEGVETEAQLAFLEQHRCDELQGYYFSEPLPPDAFGRLLAEDRRMPAASGEHSASGRTLLIVDDESGMVSALRRGLAREGYRILSANDVDEAFRLLALHPVGVVLSDQRMPGMTGVEFLSRIKALHPDVVRILLTGHADLATVGDAVNRGAVYRFFTKPWDDALLRINIQEAFLYHEWLQRQEPTPVQ